MARVQNPLIGAAKNKLGNTIFQSYNGLYVLRSKPLEVKFADTDTQKFNYKNMKHIADMWYLFKHQFAFAFSVAGDRLNVYQKYSQSMLKVMKCVLNASPVFDFSNLIIPNPVLGSVSVNNAVYNPVTGAFSSSFTFGNGFKHDTSFINCLSLVQLANNVCYLFNTQIGSYEYSMGNLTFNSLNNLVGGSVTFFVAYKNDAGFVATSPTVVIES